MSDGSIEADGAAAGAVNPASALPLASGAGNGEFSRREAFIGVDVGALSAKAGIFDSAGALIANARRPIAIWREPGEIVEQSSDDIWRLDRTGRPRAPRRLPSRQRAHR